MAIKSLFEKKKSDFSKKEIIDHIFSPFLIKIIVNTRNNVNYIHSLLMIFSRTLAVDHKVMVKIDFNNSLLIASG